MYYCRIILIAGFTLAMKMSSLAQGNCNLYPIESGERIACELSYRAIEYRQGSRESQILFDKAIENGPDYAWAYYQKSVPYFKRARFAEAVKLISKAIEIDPKTYLHYRAYWYFYNRSYDYAIKDLKLLYSTHQASFITTPGGELEMRLLLAMAHGLTGDAGKGVQWIEHLKESYKNHPHLIGQLDHLVFGMIYYSHNQLELAKEEFKKQITIDNSLSNSYYYLGLIYKQEENYKLAKENFSKALLGFTRYNGHYISSQFVEYNISKEEVKNELKSLPIDS